MPNILDLMIFLHKLILLIFSVNKLVNFKGFERMTDGFNEAMLKAVYIEVEIIGLRRVGSEITHNDYVEGINNV